jgi:hypothetical protein
VVRWSPDGRAIWVQGASDLSTHIDQVDIASGRRTPLLGIQPDSRSGLVGINLPTLADDPRTYSYELLLHESLVFVVEGAG